MNERDKPMQAAVAGTALMCAGVLIMCSSVLIGVVGCTAGEYHSYYTIENERSPTPEQLLVGVRISVVSQVVSLVVLLVGVILVVLGLVRGSRAGGSPPA